MALKYVVKKTVFGFDQTKTVKYVARPLLAGSVSCSDFYDQVARRGTVSRGVVKMVISDMVDVIEQNLSEHRSVKLEEFGSFRPAFNSKSQNEREDVTNNVLRHRKIIFTPDPRLKRMLNGMSIQKVTLPGKDMD